MKRWLIRGSIEVGGLLFGGTIGMVAGYNSVDYWRDPIVWDQSEDEYASLAAGAIGGFRMGLTGMTAGHSLSLAIERRRSRLYDEYPEPHDGPE